MKIEIRGTIVGADYDDALFDPWIAKGVITPSSRVVGAIESATEPIELYINSYGGDVFAGGEMQIAILKAAMAGKISRVEVGTCACSMAANIVAALAARNIKVYGYSNSQLMFHGCYTIAEGGAQHHEDVAESLRVVNNKVIDDLKHLGIEGCSTWFAEGREKWIGGDEAVEMKLLVGLLDGLADAPPDMKATATRLAAFAASIADRVTYAVRVDDVAIPEKNTIAAMRDTDAPQASVGSFDTTATVGSQEEPTAERSATSIESSSASDADCTKLEARIKELEAYNTDMQDRAVKAIAEVSAKYDAAQAEIAQLKADAEAIANERFAALQSKHDKEFSTLKSERDNALKDLAAEKERATSLEGEIARLSGSLAQMGDQLTVERMAHERDIQTIRNSGIALCIPESEAKPMLAREQLAALPPSKREAFYREHKDEIDNN